MLCQQLRCQVSSRKLSQLTLRLVQASFRQRQLLSKGMGTRAKFGTNKCRGNRATSTVIVVWQKLARFTLHSNLTQDILKARTPNEPRVFNVMIAARSEKLVLTPLPTQVADAVGHSPRTQAFAPANTICLGLIISLRIQTNRAMLQRFSSNSARPHT